MGQFSQTVVLGSSAARVKVEDNFVLKQNTQDFGEMEVKAVTRQVRPQSWADSEVCASNLPGS